MFMLVSINYTTGFDEEPLTGLVYLWDNPLPQLYRSFVISDLF